MVHSLVAETQNICFFDFVHVGQADFIVFRYSAINNCVPCNKWFRFQDNIIKVNCVWNRECKFYISRHSWCSFSPLPPGSVGMLRSTKLSTCTIDIIDADILCIFSESLTLLSGPLLMSEVRVLGSLNWYTGLWEYVQSIWDFSPFSRAYACNNSREFLESSKPTSRPF
jgi:hypothetical protein